MPRQYGTKSASCNGGARPSQIWRILLVIFVALGLLKIGMYFFSTSHPSPPAPAPATKDLAFVLPAVVHDVPDFGWRVSA